MKKYNKPELKVEKYLVNSTIADSTVSNAVGGNNYGANQTPNVSYDAWKDLFGN